MKTAFGVAGNGGQTQEYLQGMYDDSWQGDLTSEADWWSDNNSVMTVSSGMVTGHALGTANIYGFASNEPIYNPNFCCQSCLYCDQGVGAGGGGNVQPTVSISGPSNIPLLNPGSQGSDSITLTANGSPSGGTYSWAAVSGAANVTILNATSQSAIVQSVAVGSYTIQVTYTVSGKPGTAVTVGKVQQPGSLQAVSNTTPSFNCGNVGLPSYITHERLIQYQTLDTAGAPIAASGMTASEILNVTSNSCNVSGPSPTSGALTLSDGEFPGPDTLQLCSQQCLPAGGDGTPLGSCAMTVAQTWSVNGYQVKNDTITYTCAGPPTGAP